MPHYFLVWEAARFQEQVRPALAAAWREHDFAPSRSVCQELEPAARDYAGGFGMEENEPLLCRVARGLPFDRNYWRCLVGEILFFGAEEVPDIQTALEALCCLLGEHPSPEELPRENFAPIHQVHLGTCELTFGRAFYRPGQAGFNDIADVPRLTAYLDTLDPQSWSAGALRSLPDLDDEEERTEELEFARDWLPVLCDLYRRAAAQGRIVVCEVIR